MEKPGEFLKDKQVMLTTLGYMLKGRKHNARARRVAGPSRAEMLRIVARPEPAESSQAA